MDSTDETPNPQFRDRDEIARLFSLSTDLMATLGADGRFDGANAAWERTLGWSPRELIGRSTLELIHPDDLERTLGLAGSETNRTDEVTRFENRFRARDGSYRWLEWNARKWGDTWYAVARDVTESRDLQHQALRDALTALPHRAVLVDRLAHALERLARRPGMVAVLFIDLDRLKLINDGKGHETGDRLIRAVAGRLVRATRTADTVARLGGDEFVVLVDDAQSVGHVMTVAQRIVDTLDDPFPIDDDEVRISASVGISIALKPDATPDTLLREADVAMYRAKGNGGGRCELFDEAMRADVHRRVRVQTELRHALDRGELRLFYQPIVALPETSVVLCEALLRWQHPRRGLLVPAEFIGLAEDSGLIIPIGEWVLRQACAQAMAWRRSGSDVGIHVNVSMRQLNRCDFVELVRSVLEETKLPARCLCLEITETAIMDHAERVAPGLALLRGLGVRTAMDDFGSGYSSLNHLRSLPLDIIKIDRSFVAGLRTSPEDRAIVAAMLRLAEATERSVIAEGVETEELHAELLGLGCCLAQGFLYGRPRPADEIRLDGYSSRVQPGVGDPSLVREFMRQIGIPARITS